MATQTSVLAWKIPWTQVHVVTKSDTIEHTHSERYTGVLRVLDSKLAALGLVK